MDPAQRRKHTKKCKDQVDLSERGSTIHTIRSNVPALRVVDIDTLDELRGKVRFIAGQWGADGAPDVAEACLSLICNAESGAMIVVGMESSLRSLTVQSEDNGCMDALAKDLGIGSLKLRQLYSAFTSKEYDNEGRWAFDARYPTAHGKAKRGAWIFTEKGGILKAATLLLNLRPAPYKLVDKGMRHTVALMAGLVGSSIAFVRSDAGMLHAFAVQANAQPKDVEAWRVQKDEIISFKPPEIPKPAACSMLPDVSSSQQLQISSCSSQGELIRHICASLAPHLEESCVERAFDLSERFLSLLQDAHMQAGATVVIGFTKDFERLRDKHMLHTASSYMDKRTHSLDVFSDAFRCAFLELGVHTPDDRFPMPSPDARLRENIGEVPDEKAHGSVMDGFWLISLDSLRRVKAQCKLVGLEPCPLNCPEASSRFTSAMATAQFLETAIVLNKADRGQVHAFVHVAGDMLCFQLTNTGSFEVMAAGQSQSEETVTVAVQDLHENEEYFNLTSADLDIYHQQSELDKLREAVHRANCELGREHPKTIDAMRNVAYCALRRGDVPGWREATDILGKVLTIEIGVYGEDHPETLETMHVLAVCKRACGDVRGALDLLEAVMPKRLRVQGENHPRTLATMHALAVCKGACGDVRGALDLLEAVMPKRLRVQGEDQPETLNTMHDLAVCKRDCGDVRGALDLLEAVMPKRLRVQGEDHPETLATMHVLAVCKGACGDVRGALDLLEAVMPKRLRVQGEDHPGTLETMHALAVCKGACSDVRGALDLAEALMPNIR